LAGDFGWRLSPAVFVRWTSAGEFNRQLTTLAGDFATLAGDFGQRLCDFGR
jgi:hypothetical protein